MNTNKLAKWAVDKIHSSYEELAKENLKLRNMLTKIRYICEMQRIKDPSNKLWGDTAKYIDNPVEEMK